MSSKNPFRFIYQRPKERFKPPEKLPNRMEVPEKTILAIPHAEQFALAHEETLVNLKNHPKRDWFVQHAYFCLPITFGNLHGFGLKALFDFRAMWHGGDRPEDVSIEIDEAAPHANNLQFVRSHFGMGVVTVQNRFSLRTPKGVNLLVMNAPNFMIDGLQSMFAVVEADNLRRDFTFNLRLTCANHWVEVKAGQIIAAVLPYPRGFLDGFALKSAYDCCPREVVEEEIRTSDYFATERKDFDSKYAGGNGGRYLQGIDIYDIPFEQHQKKLD